jgi:hypothetical protein
VKFLQQTIGSTGKVENGLTGPEMSDPFFGSLSALSFGNPNSFEHRYLSKPMQMVNIAISSSKCLENKKLKAFHGGK